MVDGPKAGHIGGFSAHRQRAHEEVERMRLRVAIAGAGDDPPLRRIARLAGEVALIDIDPIALPGDPRSLEKHLVGRDGVFQWSQV
jgi:hypothetical protein